MGGMRWFITEKMSNQRHPPIVGWHRASLQTQVCGANDSNAQANIDISADLQVMFLPFSASLADRFLAKVLASWPSIPSVDTTKGVK